MWITKKTDYATRAVLALALAPEGEPLKLADIADSTGIPTSFLEQIMGQLRGAGLVRSERGPTGGYKLNHPAEEITMDRVVRLFEGQLAPIGCATRSTPEPCAMEIACPLREVWRDVRDATIDALKNVDFGTLAARAGGCWSDSAAEAGEGAGAAGDEDSGS
jgi:Rrf2 family protein